MKICFIGDARSIHLRRWIDHFSLQGNDIIVISYHKAELSNARVYTVRHEKNALLGPVMYPAETMQIAGWIRKIQPDLVHLHYISIDGLAPALFKNIPLVASVWGSDILYDFRVNRKFRMVIEHILHRADRVTATSRFLARETQKYLRPGKEVHVIPFGVDTEFFRPSGPVTENRNVTLCYMKGLESHYGPQTLLSIMPRILEKYPGTELVMAGGGSQERELRRLAEESGISALVQFPGPLSSESVKKVLGKTDIFIMPSLCHEAFGVAALEAQAMGVPVIASRRGGIPEAVLDGQTGILFDPDLPGQLLAAIFTLMDNTKLRRQMGRIGREFVSEMYEWDDCAGQMESLYASLLRTGTYKKENG